MSGFLNKANYLVKRLNKIRAAYHVLPVLIHLGYVSPAEANSFDQFVKPFPFRFSQIWFDDRGLSNEGMHLNVKIICQFVEDATAINFVSPLLHEREKPPFTLFAPDVLYTLAHPSIISTRSRTALAYFTED